MQIISRLILTDTKRRAMHWSHVLYSMCKLFIKRCQYVLTVRACGLTLAPSLSLYW